jgi:hypothetical protein
VTDPAVPDVLLVEVPLGGRVLVVSDLHLGPAATATSTAATKELAQAIDAWAGPGLLVFNGSCVELLCPGGANPDVARAALAAHPLLVRVVREFAAGPGRRVLYLPGARDGRVAWDPAVAKALREALGAEIALAAELTIQTGAGPRTVRVEPGHQLDPLTRLCDPRNPAESPLGHHLMCEVLPALGESTAQGREPGARAARREGWLSGLGSLDDPASFPRFVASRLTYRRLGRYAWVLLLPLVAALLLRLPFAVVRDAHRVASATRLALFIVLATVFGLLLIGTVVVLLVRGTWRALSGVALSRSGEEDWRDPNGRARAPPAWSPGTPATPSSPTSVGASTPIPGARPRWCRSRRRDWRRWGRRRSSSPTARWRGWRSRQATSCTSGCSTSAATCRAPR